MTLPSRVGRYRLLRRIGRGGMGEVHLGVLEAPGGVQCLAAVKIVLEASPNRQQALLAEARLAALITHPNVVRLLDAGIEGELAWFAMEYVRGCSLAELLECTGERMPPWVAARIVADVCGALHAVHEARDTNGRPLGIVHRDVSPQNLLVSRDGFVKLVDFGIARSVLQGTPTTTGVVKGKLGYLSPEQAGGAAVDRRGDVFALGVVAWETLAGRRLFKGATDGETLAAILRGDAPTLRDTAPETPAALARIVDQALAKSPSARFRTALDMQRALESAIASTGMVIGASEVADALATRAPNLVDLHEFQSRDSERQPSNETRTTSKSLPALAGNARWLGKAARVAVGLLLTTALALAMVVISTSSARQAATASQGEGKRESARLGAEVELSQPAPGPVISAAPLGTAERHALAPRSSTLPLGRAPENPAPRLRGAAPSRPPAKEHAPASAQADAVAPANDDSAYGTINVIARPTWASIAIDGKPVGATPLVAHGITPGPHTIEALPLNQRPSQQKTIRVEKGEVERVEFVFE